VSVPGNSWVKLDGEDETCPGVIRALRKGFLYRQPQLPPEPEAAPEVKTVTPMAPQPEVVAEETTPVPAQEEPKPQPSADLLDERKSGHKGKR
jgi:hypothetical protein